MVKVVCCGVNPYLVRGDDDVTSTGRSPFPGVLDLGEMERMNISLKMLLIKYFQTKNRGRRGEFSGVSSQNPLRTLGSLSNKHIHIYLVFSVWKDGNNLYDVRGVIELSATSFERQISHTVDALLLLYLNFVVAKRWGLLNCFNPLLIIVDNHGVFLHQTAIHGEVASSFMVNISFRFFLC